MTLVWNSSLANDDLRQSASRNSDNPVPDKSSKNDRCIVTRAENLAGIEDFINATRSCSRLDNEDNEDRDDDRVELANVDVTDDVMFVKTR